MVDAIEFLVIDVIVVNEQWMKWKGYCNFKIIEISYTFPLRY